MNDGKSRRNLKYYKLAYSYVIYGKYTDYIQEYNMHDQIPFTELHPDWTHI